MPIMKKFTIILFLYFSVVSVQAQTKAEVGMHRHIMNGPEKRVYTEARSNKNEVQMLFSGLFLAYKTFISSQDMASCTFTPSCSEFGIQAVKKYGPIKGIIATFDRLSRCNGLSPNKYEVDINTGLFIDAVE